MDEGKISAIFQKLQQSFRSGVTKTYQFRLEQLQGLAKFLSEQRQSIATAIINDFKCEYEAKFEVSSSYSNVIEAIDMLGKWMKPHKVSTNLAFKLDDAYVMPEPRGVVVIIGAWNYPLMLLMDPLIGAIAAGNCAVIKPSEIASHISSLIYENLPKYIDASCFAVIEGGPVETGFILNQRSNYIFYTGGLAVGKIVYEKAAKHLTPVTLELGGKSPCIVDKTADITIAANRIIWGKFFNSGQTCIAPDYILVEKGIKSELLHALSDSIKKQFGIKPQESKCLSYIVNNSHYKRLKGILQKLSTYQIYHGGSFTELQENGKFFIEPTVVDLSIDSNSSTLSPFNDAITEHPLMQEEIFGPILPIIEVESLEEAILFVNSKPNPLSVYLFSNGEKKKRNGRQNIE